jgi:hypothetical protein
MPSSSVSSSPLLVLLYPEDEVIRWYETSKNYSPNDTVSHTAARTSSIAIRLKIWLSPLKFQRESVWWLYTLQNGETNFKRHISNLISLNFFWGRGYVEQHAYTPPIPRNNDKLKTDIQSFCESDDMQSSSIVWNEVINLTYTISPMGLKLKPDKRQ